MSEGGTPPEKEVVKELEDLAIENKDVEDEEVIDFSVKHPLQRQWTMWFNPPQKQTSKSGVWTSNTSEVMTFGTVEDFWGLWNNLVPPSKLSNGANYHLFKHGVKPEWEHDFNVNGGKWLLSFPRKGDTMAMFDEAWLTTVLLIVGENFEDWEEISGVVVSPRAKHFRLALWTRHAENADACKRIGRCLKEALKLTSPVGYQVHADAMRHGSSFRNAQRYSV
mmetsp:Transcript_5476/g.8566  ORF Transcript_5476/g.8566 Transcript_5476/m.8566 type:complete len:222 (-) Transcript_5476:202-867(-)|eukprot:CAMPEP_0175097994 /NCGR_PEP_ID=MMETSP0086_2-20121207/5592_1 /TAXON_ID=136419 /ORGANISM="Unknown Unknown, Strain D1" /LENGTH=221 /DNA_ID=CAMNT_0016371559 /DNA_START=53 /DNA_END=718 /DNA_ORIENTATION=-